MTARLVAAAKAALTELDRIKAQNMGEGVYRAREHLLAALAEAEAQPVQEPVAWRYRYHDRGAWHLADASFDGSMAAEGLPTSFEQQPLYAAPPQPVPLTPDKDKPNAVKVPGYGYVDTNAVRAVERAHGIGGKP